MITVVIPVGPYPVYREYLQECLDSLKVQTVKPSEVILIDDMAGLEEWDEINIGNLPIKVLENLWHSGQAHSVNFGIALARNELVFMLNSDDKLMPWALEDCLRTWKDIGDPLGFYWCDIEYSDTGEYQGCATSAAMVTKQLWRRSGGYPVESSVGMPDSIFVAILLVNKDAGTLIHVESEKPPYWYRRHPLTMTYRSHGKGLMGAAGLVREKLPLGWERPVWIREKIAK